MLSPGALRLIAITDNLRDGIPGLVARAQAAVRGGVTMVHVRLPDEPPRVQVQVARALLQALRVPVLVHGRVDVALAAGASGVHLSDRDPEPSVIRRIVPAELLIGASVADMRGLARVDGADYVAAGPVFGARAGESGILGVDAFGEIVRGATCPVVAIGGITGATVKEAMRGGAAGVGVLSALFAASDPESAARRLAEHLGNA